MPTCLIPTRIATAVAVAALAFTTLPNAAHAAAPPSVTGSFAAAEHGPDPAPDAPRTDGGFTFRQQNVSALRTPGFGGGTLFYPTNGSPTERFSAIIAMPDRAAPQSAMHTLARRLASHGFVVFSVNPRSALAGTHQRADALLSATEWLKSSNEVRDVLDPSSIGLLGHSLGAGGALLAAEQYDYRMIAAVHPRSERTAFPGLTEPVFVVGSSRDTVAPNHIYAEPIYDGLTGARHRGYLNRLDGGHRAALGNDPLIMERIVPAFKEMLDDDFRMTPILCKPAEAGTTWVNTCPQYWVSGPGALSSR